MREKTARGKKSPKQMQICRRKKEEHKKTADRQTSKIQNSVVVFFSTAFTFVGPPSLLHQLCCTVLFSRALVRLRENWEVSGLLRLRVPEGCRVRLDWAGTWFLWRSEGRVWCGCQSVCLFFFLHCWLGSSFDMVVVVEGEKRGVVFCLFML